MRVSSTGFEGSPQLFGQLPTAYVLLGGTLVVGAGVLLLTDRVSDRGDAAQAQPRL